MACFSPYAYSIDGVADDVYLELEGPALTVEEHVVVDKSRNLYAGFLNMISTCDEYLDYWTEQKKYPFMYLLNKGKLAFWGDQKRRAVQDIEETIGFLQEKKNKYILLLGKLYKSAYPYIDEDVPLIKKTGFHVGQQVLHLVAHMTKNEDAFHKTELQSIKHAQPPTHVKRNAVNYTLAAAAFVVGAGVLYTHKDILKTCTNTFYKNNLEKPLKGLKDYSQGKKDLDMSARIGDVSEKDIEAQVAALQNKIKTFIKAVRPDENQEPLDGILDHAKSECMERIVVDLVNKSDISANTSKVGWIEWVFGKTLTSFLGMPPKAKFLEVEIKGLISRLHATKMMLEAKNLMKDNRLVLILLTLTPMAVASYLTYATFKRCKAWFTGESKKAQQLKNLLFKINEVVNDNIGKDMSCECQGLLCYYAHRLRKTSCVVPKALQESFTGLVYVLQSCTHSVEQKMQILQSIHFALYTS